MCEKQLVTFCQQYIKDLIHNTRQIIKPYQLDIYSPSLNLAIEFNGVYWHNKNKKTKNYHLNKTLLCQKKQIQLIHIWQDDWQKNKDFVKNNLIKIFSNKQIITNIKSKQLSLDRCWFKYEKIINICNKIYILENITQPELCSNNCYNCGRLIYKQL